MRLLHTTDLTLYWFVEPNVPKYAILSHTWGSDEVLYEDIRDGKADKRQAHSKVTSACQLAASQDYEYIWIDTCCIDKTSSAELSEAINSMFRWYWESSVCYAYLEDIDVTLESRKPEMARGALNASKKPKWFSRGFTLQELIAPSSVEFYDLRWTSLGTRSSHAEVINEITNINCQLLTRVYNTADPSSLLLQYSVAHRMSWASGRRTTRPEDLAYCLLGIFCINLTLFYGEGRRDAFYRLQEQIFRRYDDQTILAWSPIVDRRGDSLREHRSWFALDPDEFLKCGNAVSFRQLRNGFSLTERGMQVRLPLVEPDNGQSLYHMALLDCHLPDDFRGPIAIPLRVLGRADDALIVARDMSYGESQTIETQDRPSLKTLFFPRDPQLYLDKTLDNGSLSGIRIQVKPPKRPATIRVYYVASDVNHFHHSWFSDTQTLIFGEETSSRTPLLRLLFHCDIFRGAQSSVLGCLRFHVYIKIDQKSQTRIKLFLDGPHDILGKADARPREWPVLSNGDADFDYDEVILEASSKKSVLVLAARATTSIILQKCITTLHFEIFDVLSKNILEPQPGAIIKEHRRVWKVKFALDAQSRST